MAGTNYKCSSHQSSPLYEVAAVSISIVLSLAVIGLLAVALHCCLRWLKEAQEDDASDCRRASTNGDDRVVPQHQQPARRRWSWRWSGRRSRSCARTGGQTAGWPEATCAVCLAEMSDGDNVRVLPVCMHYFHAACVADWLLAHHTCPLCRGPLHPVAAAG